MSRFKVHLERVRLFGYHGVLDEEKTDGQDFEIDIRFWFEKRNAEDDIKQTIDYASVYETSRAVFNKKRYDLLETLVEDIADKIMKNFKNIEKVYVTAKKTSPPVGGDVDCVKVSIKKDRN